MIDSFTVEVSKESEFVEITARVQQALAMSQVSEGLCHVFIPHTTAGITIQENADPDVVYDILMVLERLVPQDVRYRHAEGNSASHVKASLMGSSVSIPFAQGRLQLGRWQGIYLCEFDGPRTRKVIVTLIASQ